MRPGDLGGLLQPKWFCETRWWLCSRSDSVLPNSQAVAMSSALWVCASRPGGQSATRLLRGASCQPPARWSPMPCSRWASCPQSSTHKWGLWTWGCSGLGDHQSASVLTVFSPLPWQQSKPLTGVTGSVGGLAGSPCGL